MKDLERPAPGWAAGLSFCLWAMTDIVLLLKYAVVFDIITGTCDYQDLRNEGLKFSRVCRMNFQIKSRGGKNKRMGEMIKWQKC